MEIPRFFKTINRSVLAVGAAAAFAVGGCDGSPSAQATPSLQPPIETPNGGVIVDLGAVGSHYEAYEITTKTQDCIAVVDIFTQGAAPAVSCLKP